MLYSDDKINLAAVQWLLATKTSGFGGGEGQNVCKGRLKLLTPRHPGFEEHGLARLDLGGKQKAMHHRSQSQSLYFELSAPFSLILIFSRLCHTRHHSNRHTHQTNCHTHHQTNAHNHCYPGCPVSRMST